MDQPGELADGAGSWAADEAVFAAERQRVGVAITAPTLCAVAEVMARHADHATGRHWPSLAPRSRNEVGCDVRTVTAAWRLLRTTGWAGGQRGHGSPGTPAVGRRPGTHLPLDVPAPARSAVQHFHLHRRQAGLRSLTPVGNRSLSTHRADKVHSPQPQTPALTPDRPYSPPTPGRRVGRQQPRPRTRTSGPSATH